MRALLALALLALPTMGTSAASPSAASPSAASPALPDGRYALEMRYLTEARVPVLGEVLSETTILALVELREGEDSELAGRQRVCAVDLGEGVGIARTVFPERLVRSMPARDFVIDLEGERLRADLGLDTMGFDPEVTGGRLPTSASDPGVVDIDGDERPGGTIVLEVKGIGRFPLSVVSRGRTVLDGRVVSEGRAEGEARLVEFEQRVLGGLPVSGEVSGVESAPGRNRFVLERVDPDATCAELPPLLEREGDETIDR